jgi:hypothetical protein
MATLQAKLNGLDPKGKRTKSGYIGKVIQPGEVIRYEGRLHWPAGEIIAYRRKPRNKSEILCHNHILHTRDMPHGANGFRADMDVTKDDTPPLDAVNQAVTRIEHQPKEIAGGATLDPPDWDEDDHMPDEGIEDNVIPIGAA